jgi:glycosyltransferase involved in cell wall biosynthesis
MPTIRNTHHSFSGVPKAFQKNPFLKLSQPQTPVRPPITKSTLPKSIFYCADSGGCGFWRMIWPAEHLLAYKKADITITKFMHLDKLLYSAIDSVKLQRQLTPLQLDFVKALKKEQKETLDKYGKTFRLIWEVDDVVFPTKDIPDYNVKKSEFVSKVQQEEVVKELIHLCDEVTVVSNTMRNHYQRVLDYDRISVIPNYFPRAWADRYFDPEKMRQRYHTHKNKPRILYNGSATHFDLRNKTNQLDDFTHLARYVRKTVDKYQWIFLGSHPLTLKDLIDSGKIEYYSWVPLFAYQEAMAKTEAMVTIAPLLDTTFNRCKSSLKIYEAGAHGMPCVAQNLPCYDSEAHWLFTDAESLEDQLQTLLRDEQSYMEAVCAANEAAQGMWLEDHMDEHLLVLSTPYGDERRKENGIFLKNNIHQF